MTKPVCRGSGAHWRQLNLSAANACETFAITSWSWSWSWRRSRCCLQLRLPSLPIHLARLPLRLNHPPLVLPFASRRCKWEWLGRLRPLRNFNDVQFKLFEIQKQRKVCFALCCAPNLHYKRNTVRQGVGEGDVEIGRSRREGVHKSCCTTLVGIGDDDVDVVAFTLALSEEVWIQNL